MKFEVSKGISRPMKLEVSIALKWEMIFQVYEDISVGHTFQISWYTFHGWGKELRNVKRKKRGVIARWSPPGRPLCHEVVACSSPNQQAVIANHSPALASPNRPWDGSWASEAHWARPPLTQQAVYDPPRLSTGGCTTNGLQIAHVFASELEGDVNESEECLRWRSWRQHCSPICPPNGSDSARTMALWASLMIEV